MTRDEIIWLCFWREYLYILYRPAIVLRPSTQSTCSEPAGMLKGFHLIWFGLGGWSDHWVVRNFWLYGWNGWCFTEGRILYSQALWLLSLGAVKAVPLSCSAYRPKLHTCTEGWYLTVVWHIGENWQVRIVRLVPEDYSDPQGETRDTSDPLRQTHYQTLTDTRSPRPSPSALPPPPGSQVSSQSLQSMRWIIVVRGWYGEVPGYLGTHTESASPAGWDLEVCQGRDWFVCPEATLDLH